MNRAPTLRVFFAIASATLVHGACSYREDPKVEARRQIAQENRTKCHRIGRADESPIGEAPPSKRLHERYKIDDLAEAFAEGIVVGHKEMPPFAFEPRKIDALLAYLKSLERQ